MKNENVERYHEEDTFKDGNNEWKVLYGKIDNADPVLVKLNELLRNGQIKKDFLAKKIYFKYLKDTVEFFINPKHESDPEEVEFFQLLSILVKEKLKIS